MRRREPPLTARTLLGRGLGRARAWAGPGRGQPRARFEFPLRAVSARAEVELHSSVLTRACEQCRLQRWWKDQAVLWMERRFARGCSRARRWPACGEALYGACRAAPCRSQPPRLWSPRRWATPVTGHAVSTGKWNKDSIRVPRFKVSSLCSGPGFVSQSFSSIYWREKSVLGRLRRRGGLALWAEAAWARYPRGIQWRCFIRVTLLNSFMIPTWFPMSTAALFTVDIIKSLLPLICFFVPF